MTGKSLYQQFRNFAEQTGPEFNDREAMQLLADHVKGLDADESGKSDFLWGLAYSGFSGLCGLASGGHPLAQSMLLNVGLAAPEDFGIKRSGLN